MQSEFFTGKIKFDMNRNQAGRMTATALFVTGISVLSACRKNTVTAPKPDEQELITALKVRLSRDGAAPVWFTYSVRNGFTGNAEAVRIDTIRLSAHARYDAAIFLYDESANPVKDVTGEIIAEKNKHLFYHESSGSDSAKKIKVSNLDADGNGEPFGRTSTWETGASGSSTMRIILIHGPRRKNGGNPAAIAGATDADAQFPVVTE